MCINHVLALRDYLYESSERPAGSALRGKPTADRRPHPLCVVQPLDRAQQWGIEQLRFATDEAAGACHLRHCGRQRRGGDCPITHLIDNPPHAALSAFIKTKPVDLTMNTFNRGTAVRLDDITKKLLNR